MAASTTLYVPGIDLAEEIKRRKAAEALTSQDQSDSQASDTSSDPDPYAPEPDPSEETSQPQEPDVAGEESGYAAQESKRQNPNAQSLNDYFPVAPKEPAPKEPATSEPATSERVIDIEAEAKRGLDVAQAVWDEQQKEKAEKGIQDSTLDKMLGSERDKYLKKHGITPFDQLTLDQREEYLKSRGIAIPETARLAGAAPATTAPGVEPPSPEAKRATPVKQSATGFYSDEKPGDFITGRASMFGDQGDIDRYNEQKSLGATDQEAFQVGDNGIGSKYVGGLRTTNLMGIAVPEDALRTRYGNNYAAWRRARVDIVDPTTGQRLRVPIVDLGPGEGPQSKGVIADFTPGLDQYFVNNGGGKNYHFRLVDDAGPDVAKHPQTFWDEQAALHNGFDSASVKKSRQTIASNYVLSYEDPAKGAAIEQADAFNQQSQKDTLAILKEEIPNIGALYKRLEAPVEGVSDAMRKSYQDLVKEFGTKEAQDYYNEKDPAKAWATASSDASFGTFAGEAFSKVIPYMKESIFAFNKAADTIDENRVNQFINIVNPNARPEERVKFYHELINTPKNDRGHFIEKLRNQLDPQVAATFSTADIMDSVNNMADPKRLAERKAILGEQIAKNLRDLRTDPRLAGTPAEFWTQQLASLPKNYMEAMTGMFGQSLMLSEIRSAASDQIRAENPNMTDEEVEAKANVSTLAQLIPQEIMMRVLGGKLGGAFRGIQSPARRIAANALLNLGVGAGAGGVQQLGANIATGRPILKDTGEATLGGAIQGAIGAGHSVIHELTQPRPGVGQPVAPTDTTTGKAGAPIRGASDATLNQTAQPPPPPPPEATVPPVAPVAPPSVRTSGGEEQVFSRPTEPATGDIAASYNDLVTTGMAPDVADMMTGQEPEAPTFTSKIHARVYRELIGAGMDPKVAHDLLEKADGSSYADVLDDVRAQMKDRLDAETPTPPEPAQPSVRTSGGEEQAFSGEPVPSPEAKTLDQMADLSDLPDEASRVTAVKNITKRRTKPAEKAKPVEQEKSAEAKPEIEQALLDSYRGEHDTNLAAVVASHQDPIAKQVLFERYGDNLPHDVRYILDPKYKAAHDKEIADQSAKAEAEHRAEMEAELKGGSGRDDLLSAVQTFGGLPNPQKLKNAVLLQKENLTGEMGRVHDAWKGLNADTKRALNKRGIFYKKLFRDDVAGLDQIRGSLAQHPDGFAYETPSQMLDAVGDALQKAAQGEQVFGSNYDPHIAESAINARVDENGNPVTGKRIREPSDESAFGPLFSRRGKTIERAVSGPGARSGDAGTERQSGDNRVSDSKLRLRRPPRYFDQKNVVWSKFQIGEIFDDVLSKFKSIYNAIGVDIDTDPIGHNIPATMAVYPRADGKIFLQVNRANIGEAYSQHIGKVSEGQLRYRFEAGLQEELIHAGQMLGSKEKWIKEGKPGNFNDYTFKEAAILFDHYRNAYYDAIQRGDYQAAKDLELGFQKSTRAYTRFQRWLGEHPTFQAFDEFIDGGMATAHGKTKPFSEQQINQVKGAISYEMARQYVQMNLSGRTNERTSAILHRSVREWVMDTLKAIRRIAAKVKGGLAGQVWKDTINTLEDWARQLQETGTVAKPAGETAPAQLPPTEAAARTETTQVRKTPLEQQRQTDLGLGDEPFSLREDTGREVSPEDKHRELLTATHTPESNLKQAWNRLSKLVTGFRSQVPEAGSKGAVTGTIKIQQWERYIKGVGQKIRTDSANDVAKILRPVLAVTPEKHPGLIRNLSKLNDAIAARRKDQKPIPKPWLDKRAQLEAIQNSNPLHLFQQAILYRDLYFRSQTAIGRDSEGNWRYQQLPMGLTKDHVIDKLVEIKKHIGKLSPEAQDGLRESLRSHYRLVRDIKDELIARGFVIPKELENPYYFPHLLLENMTGHLGNPKINTQEDFRRYLINPVGSEKKIETNYVKAMLQHLVEVRNHNERQDATERYIESIDRSGPYKRTMATENNRRLEAGGLLRNLLPFNDWERRARADGLEIFTANKRLPLRMEAMIDRQKLGERIGKTIHGPHIAEQLRRLKVDLTADDLTQALTSTEPIKWALHPKEAAALRGVLGRADNEATAHHGWGSWFAKGGQKLLNAWKWWHLFSPTSAIRYNYGDFVSDLEKVATRDPAVLRKLGPALKEVRQFVKTGKYTSPDLEAAVRHDVISSPTAQELGKVDEFPQLRDLVERPHPIGRGLHKIGQLGADFATMRDRTFRYAKYMADMERLRAGKPVPMAALKRDLDAEPTMESRAAKNAREMFVDYSALSPGGVWMRKNAIPFYSWMEGNFRYHVNLFRNFHDMSVPNKAEFLAKKAPLYAGKLLFGRATRGFLLRAAMVNGGLAAWNAFQMHQHNIKDSDLSDEDKRHLFIVTGKDPKTGEVHLMYLPTATSDVASWLGGPAFSKALEGYLSKKTSLGQAVQRWMTGWGSDVTNKIAQSVRPELLSGVGALAKLEFFPNVFKPRKVPEYDQVHNLIKDIFDQPTADLIESFRNNKFLPSKTLDQHLAQMILQQRYREPEKENYYAARDRADQFLHDKGIDREPGTSNNEEAMVVRNLRRSMYSGDVPTAMRFAKMLVDQYGYNSKKFAASLRAQDPLSAISKDNLKEYLASLSDFDREQLAGARRYAARLQSAPGTQLTQSRAIFGPTNKPKLNEKALEAAITAMKDDVKRDAAAKRLMRGAREP